MKWRPALRHPAQVAQLPGHHCGPAHRQPQRGLMQVEGEGGRAVPAEQALAGQPGGHPVVHLGGLSRRSDYPSPEHQPSFASTG